MNIRKLWNLSPSVLHFFLVPTSWHQLGEPMSYITEPNLLPTSAALFDEYLRWMSSFIVYPASSIRGGLRSIELPFPSHRQNQWKEEWTDCIIKQFYRPSWHTGSMAATYRFTTPFSMYFAITFPLSLLRSILHPRSGEAFSQWWWLGSGRPLVPLINWGCSFSPSTRSLSLYSVFESCGGSPSHGRVCSSHRVKLFPRNFPPLDTNPM